MSTATSPTATRLTIGHHTLPNSVVVAPMAGVSDMPFRALCLALGAGMAVAEMVSADARLKSSRKSRLRRQKSAQESINAVQIVGSDPALLAEAARFNVDEGADIIDINMGCPAKKVCRKAAGSALLADESLVGRILEAVVRSVTVPVTLKTRTGIAPEARNGVRIAEIAQESGIAMLTVHGRTRADRFLGAAEYDTLAEIVQRVRLPVLANGDIDSAAKARAVLNHTGAAGVMIGRAAQGQPWLPGLIARQLAGDDTATPPCWTEQCRLIMNHVEQLHGFYGPTMGVRIARKHVGWFIDNSPIAQDIAASSALSKRTFNVLESTNAQTDWLQQLADVGMTLASSTSQLNGAGQLSPLAA